MPTKEANTDRGLSRRGLLGAGAAAAGVAAVGASTQSASGWGLKGLLPPIPGVTTPGGLLDTVSRIVDPVLSGVDLLGLVSGAPLIDGFAPGMPTTVNPEVLHRLRRWTYGPTPELLASVQTMAQADAYLEAQLFPSNVNDAAALGAVDTFPSNRLSTANMRSNYVRTRGAVLVTETMVSKMIRAVKSNRQLQERLVDVWSDHFNVPAAGSNLLYRQHMENNVLRPNALGSFSDMLIGVVKHPAMLNFLDAAVSVAGNPNQNYARELMELHTLGVNGGFGEDDVYNASRLLTGMTIRGGSYVYNPSLRDSASVTVCGSTFGGSTSEADIDVFLRFLARQPATARTVARKLCVVFVSDNPSDALIAQIAQAYLDADTEIVPVLRVLFNTTEFADAKQVKLYRPFEQLAATMRAANVFPELGWFGTVQGVTAMGFPAGAPVMPGSNVYESLISLIPGGIDELDMDLRVFITDTLAGNVDLLSIGNDPGAALSVLSHSMNNQAAAQVAYLVLLAGSAPGSWGAPNGMPATGNSFLSPAAMYQRLNAATRVVSNTNQVFPSRFQQLLGVTTPRTRRDLFIDLFERLIYRTPTDNEINVLSGGSANNGTLTATQIEGRAAKWASTIVALPENQLR